MQGSGGEDPRRKEEMGKSTAENSTTMTIEFLRARLLSERSVSRTARQRADQLAKRVVELEEELKVVTSQRKKAERAAMEVVAILKNLGLSDISEAFDSNSDNDEDDMSESRESSNSTKEGETSVTSKMENEAEDRLSTSENGASLPGRSLSWKSKDTKNSDNYGKKIFSRARWRQNSIMHNDSPSPKNQLGKSCRQIKIKELRTEDVRDLSFDGTSVGDISNDFERRPDVSNGDFLDDKDRSVLDNLVLQSADKQIEENMFVVQQGDARSEEMDRVLEHQAQLIGLFEEEENAQREWEEKYRENAKVFVDPGESNRKLDETKEKTEGVGPPEVAFSVTQEIEATKAQEKAENNSRSIDSANIQIHEASSSLKAANINSGMYLGESALPANSHVQTNIHGQQILEAESSRPESHLVSVAVAGNYTPSSGTFNWKVDHLGNKHLQTHHQTSNELNGVLEALNVAKLSLQQELHKMPQPINQILALPAPGDVPIYQNLSDSSLGSSSLFRLPTEIPYQSPGPLSMGPFFADHSFDLKARAGSWKGSPGASSNGVPSTSASVDIARSKLFDGNLYLDSRITGSMLPNPHSTLNLPTGAPSLSPYNYLDEMRRPMFERHKNTSDDNSLLPSMHNIS